MADRDAVSSGSGEARSAFASVDGPGELEAQRIHRFVLGIDDGARPMTDDEVASELDDPFARLLLRQGVFPQDVNEVLSGIDAAVADDSPLHRESQASFLVGEGSQILWSEETASVRRGLRLVVTRGQNNLIDLLVSTAASGDFADRFLQVMGWDETNGVFHYYELRSGTWVWAGHSFHALDPRSRGKGPFDSHVNGAMVLKELKFPWVHWQSVAASVPPEVFAPGDPAAEDPLLTGASGAEFLEEAVVLPGIERWTTARFAKTIPDSGPIEQVPQLMTQLFETTTVNLTSSRTESRTIEPAGSIDLPATFFVDADTLASDELGLAAPPRFSVPGQAYLDALAGFDVALVDGAFHQDGDTHFAFVVPERAFEDLSVVRRLVAIGVLSDRFVACALMVDFANPVFSARRAALLRHVPGSAERAGATSDLPDQVVAAVEAAAADGPQDGPEREFMVNWEVGTRWREEFDGRLSDYYTALAARLADPAGFADVFRLAESRRQRVRDLELSEGRPLLFASTSIPADAPPLAMGPDASVAEDV